MRATVLTAEDGFTLVLTFHHVLSDGVSAINIVQDLLKALDGQRLPRLPSLPSREVLAAERVGPFHGAGEAAPVPGASVETLRSLGKLPLWRAFDGDRPTVSTCILEREATSSLLVQCRQHGTTLNGALCAAVARSATRQGGKATFTIANAVNLRDVVAAGHDSCGLLAGIAPVTFFPPDRQGFWDLARQTTREIAPSRTLDGALRSMNALTASLPPGSDSTTASGFFGLYNYDSVVSNLGALPIPARIGSFRLKTFWGPAVQGRFKDELVIGAIGVHGRLHVMQTSPVHVGSILPGLLDEMLSAASGA